MNPAIVISAFNRPHSLARLLAALSKAEYPDDGVPLVISIDRSTTGSNQHVCDVAEQFDWKFGPKRIVKHKNHLGLVQHVFYCGGLSQEYGSVVFLEDDLGVSPVFYKYASRALAFYNDDECVAGISLYALWFNGYTKHPFIPLADGTDVFFLQIPYTQGQAWTQKQWQRFGDWRAKNEHRPTSGDNLHKMWLDFDAEDHFPIMTKYLVSTNSYYAFPRVSLTTGMGDAGTHFAESTQFFQTPLLQAKDSFAFRNFDDSFVVYDSFFEIRPDRLNRLTNALRGYEYDVDLYATKEPRHLRSACVLTSRRSRSPILAFGKAMWPMEANVIDAIPGAGILLSKIEDVRWDWLAELDTQKHSHEYFTRRQRLGKRRWLEYALLDLLRRS
jgi:hypothetical protein